MMSNLFSGLTIDSALNLLVGLLVKTVFVMFVVLALIVIRQADLMDRVINIPVGGWFRILAWVFFLLTIVLTILVMLLV